jgi:plasmid stabilization system protein ParE
VSAWYAERHPSGHDRFFDDFATARHVLGMFPFAGRERDEIRAGVRSMVVHPYLVFYQVDEAVRVVTVLRVIHGSRDFGPDDFETD